MTQSLNNFDDEKSQFFYGTSIFESVTGNNKYSNRTILIRNLVTYHLVVISCKNSNFERHQSNFREKRSHLPLVISYRDISVYVKTDH